MDKKNDSLGIYYLIILFLIIMIIIPPLFRYLMPNNTNTNTNNNTNNTNTNQNINNNTNVNPNTNNNTNVNPNTNTTTPTTNTISTLTCNLDDELISYNIVSKYNSEKISNIIFTYTLKQGQISNDAKVNNMFTVINNLRTVKGATVQENTNKISVEFNLEGNQIQEELNMYTQEKNTQKASYEALGFKCSLD